MNKMDTTEIKRDILAQIVKANQSFGKNGPLGIKDPMKEDIGSLERNLKKIGVYFKLYLIGAILLTTILFVVSFLKTFKMLDNLDLNNGGLMILFTIVFGLNAFAYYKFKVNLENKIYLLKLLRSID